MALQRIRDLLETRVEFLTFYITGVTPNSLNELITTMGDELTFDLVTKLVSVSLIAMGSNRATMQDFLSKADNADILNLVNRHFSIQNHVNFAALNLLGHLLLAGGLRSTSNSVASFRKKLGNDSIWHTNISRSELSDKQKEILEEKIKRMPAAATIPIAQQIVLKLVQKKIPPPDPPANGTDDTNNDNNATATNIPIHDPVHVLPTQPPTVAGPSMYTPTFAATFDPLRALDEQLRKANDDAAATRANEETTFKEQEDARMLRKQEIETRREQERIDREAAEARQREEARRKADDEAAKRERILKEQSDKTVAGGAVDEPADEDLGANPDEEMLDADDPANITDKTSSASGKGKGAGSSADKSGAASGKKRKIIKTDKLPKPNTRSSAGKPKILRSDSCVILLVFILTFG